MAKTAQKDDDSHWIGEWYVRIDHWHPTRLNELLNVHWATRNRRKKMDREVIGFHCLGAGVTEAARKRYVGLEITLAPRQRAADPDAYWKTVLDALVHCKALRNDSPAWCELLPVTYLRGPEKRTVIYLKDFTSRELHVDYETKARKSPPRICRVRLNKEETFE